MVTASLFYFFMLLVILTGIFGSPEETAQNGLTDEIQGSSIESNEITATDLDEPPEQSVDAPSPPTPTPPAKEDTPEKQEPAPQPPGFLFALVLQQLSYCSTYCSTWLDLP